MVMTDSCIKILTSFVLIGNWNNIQPCTVAILQFGLID